jgi:hypothetical protein
MGAVPVTAKRVIAIAIAAKRVAESRIFLIIPIGHTTGRDFMQTGSWRSAR